MAILPNLIRNHPKMEITREQSKKLIHILKNAKSISDKSTSIIGKTQSKTFTRWIEECTYLKISDLSLKIWINRLENPEEA
jgi:hypothetical protein